MSRPILVHYVALLGRRAMLTVAVACVVMIATSGHGQGREAIDVVAHAGDTLSRSNNSTLLGIISITAMLLAGFFGWIDKSALQIIQTKITEIEGHLRRMKCVKPEVE